MKRGLITRVLNDGFAYIVIEGQEYVFSFGKIVHYRGETAEELGLHSGRFVSVIVIPKNNVT